METLVNVVKYLLSQRWIRIPLILFLGGWWLSSCCTVYIGPNEVGIHAISFGSKSGIQKEPWQTGTCLVIPNYERVLIFPTDLQAAQQAPIRREKFQELTQRRTDRDSDRRQLQRCRWIIQCCIASMIHIESSNNRAGFGCLKRGGWFRVRTMRCAKRWASPDCGGILSW